LTDFHPLFDSGQTERRKNFQPRKGFSKFKCVLSAAGTHSTQTRFGPVENNPAIGGVMVTLNLNGT
jgi:hypothetical protein